MKTFLFVISTLTLVVFSLSSCNFVPEVGSGNVIADSVSFSGIDKFEFSSACEGTVIQIDSSIDSSYIIVHIDDNLMDDVDLDRDGDKLHIGMKAGAFDPTKFTATVYCHSLAEASASGASEVTLKEFDNADEFTSDVSGASTFKGTFSCSEMKLNISGASTFSGDFTCEDLSIDISGASEISMDGNGHDLDLECSGASEAELQSFTINDASFDISGASTVKVRAEGTISGSISGASEFYYYGSPTLGTIDKCSSCEVTKK